MKLRTIPCDGYGTPDRVVFSRSGRYMASAGTSLNVVSVPKLKRVRISVDEQPVSVCFRTPDRTPDGDSRTDVLFTTRRQSQVQRFRIESREWLRPLRLPSDYVVRQLVESPDGMRVAAADEHGYLSVWTMNNHESPERIFSRQVVQASIDGLAFGENSESIFFCDCAKQQWKLHLETEQLEPLHNERIWQCYTMASHASGTGLAMGGDGDRVWLIDLPFELNSDDPSVAASGYPFASFEMNDGDFAREFELNRRIYTPAVDETRCAYINCDAGDAIVDLHLTDDWHLLVVGTTSTQLWDLRSTTKLENIGYRYTLSRRYHAAVACGNDLLVAMSAV